MPSAPEMALQVEGAIATLNSSIDAAENAIRTEGGGVLGWLASNSTLYQSAQAAVTGHTAADRLSVLSNIRLSTQRWVNKGRSLANGAVWAEPDPQKAMDDWLKAGRDIVVQIGDIQQINADTTLARIIVDTTVATATDVKDAAVQAFKLMPYVLAAAALVVGVVVYRKATR